MAIHLGSKLTKFKKQHKDFISNFKPNKFRCTANIGYICTNELHKHVQKKKWNNHLSKQYFSTIRPIIKPRLHEIKQSKYLLLYFQFSIDVNKLEIKVNREWETHNRQRLIHKGESSGFDLLVRSWWWRTATSSGF